MILDSMVCLGILVCSFFKKAFCVMLRAGLFQKLIFSRGGGRFFLPGEKCCCFFYVAWFCSTESICIVKHISLKMFAYNSPKSTRDSGSIFVVHVFWFMYAFVFCPIFHFQTLKLESVSVNCAGNVGSFAVFLLFIFVPVLLGHASSLFLCSLVRSLVFFCLSLSLSLSFSLFR